MLPIAPSTYHDHLAKRVDPVGLSDRARRDVELKPEISRVFEANFRVYGVRKVWRQMRREGFDVARCTVARLMKELGVEGVIRGKKIRTMIPDKAVPCPLDRVNRHFRAPAPDMLWVNDFRWMIASANWSASLDARRWRSRSSRRHRTSHAQKTDVACAVAAEGQFPMTERPFKRPAGRDGRPDA